MGYIIPYLPEGGSFRHGDLVESIDGYAHNRGHRHEEADGQGPLRVHIISIGDGLVLNHREDQDELLKKNPTKNNTGCEKIILRVKTADSGVQNLEMKKGLSFRSPCKVT